MDFSSLKEVLPKAILFPHVYFIIAAEFLSRGLNHLYSQYLSLRYCSTAPIIVSHLSIANDVVIFANGNHPSLRQIIDFLHHYEAVLGQLIREAKKNFYIEGSTSASRQAIVHSITGFQWCQLLFIYLGCPVFIGCLKIYHFDNMVRKVRIRSRVGPIGCYPLVGSGAYSTGIVFYATQFHVLRPHVVVVRHLERLFTQFLWSDFETRRQIH